MSSIFDTIEQKPADNYEFFTGEDKDFLQEMKVPVQNMNAPEAPEFDLIDSQPDELDENKLKQFSDKEAKGTAKLLVTAIDVPVSSLFAFIAKEKDASRFACTPDERDTLNEALTEYLKLKGADIPPGMMLMIVILTIYGGKALSAFKMRAANVRAENAENALNEIKKENEALKIKLDELEPGKK